MKKLAILLFVMASMVCIAPPVEARTTNAAESAITELQRRDRQDRYQQRRERRERRYERRENRRDRRYDRRNNNRRYQNQGYYGNRRYENRSRVRTTYQSRMVRRGRALYRETYRVMYLPNGRVNTQLVSRVRVRNY
ncbi:MAG TPA: hypothetical protein VK892_05815 [Pyrinomonadaceae bacterium]|nr:hypothetical protein [Pyrinomonadaceae bacterium]